MEDHNAPVGREIVSNERPKSVSAKYKGRNFVSGKGKSKIFLSECIEHGKSNDVSSEFEESDSSNRLEYSCRSAKKCENLRKDFSERYVRNPRHGRSSGVGGQVPETSGERSRRKSPEVNRSENIPKASSSFRKDNVFTSNQDNLYTPPKGNQIESNVGTHQKSNSIDRRRCNSVPPRYKNPIRTSISSSSIHSNPIEIFRPSATSKERRCNQSVNQQSGFGHVQIENCENRSQSNFILPGCASENYQSVVDEPKSVSAKYNRGGGTFVPQHECNSHDKIPEEKVPGEEIHVVQLEKVGNSTGNTKNGEFERRHRDRDLHGAPDGIEAQEYYRPSHSPVLCSLHDEHGTSSNVLIDESQSDHRRTQRSSSGDASQKASDFMAESKQSKPMSVSAKYNARQGQHQQIEKKNVQKPKSVSAKYNPPEGAKRKKCVSWVLQGKKLSDSGIQVMKMDPSWEVHAPNVSVMNHQQLIAQMTDQEQTRMQILKQLIEPAYEMMRSMSQRRTRADYNLRPKDVEKMIINGIIREIVGKPKNFVRVFVVPEPSKKRYRIITWPKELNGQIQATYIFDEQFSDLQHLKQLIMENSCAQTFDIKAAYYQIALESSGNYCFDYDGKLYEFVRLPMGVVPACEFVQRLVSQLANKSEKDSIVHIDNVMYAGKDRSTVEKRAENFIQRCSKCSVTLNDYELPSNTVKFWNLECDFKEKSVMMSQSWLDKLASSSVNKIATVKEIFQLFGRLLYASRVLERNIGDYFLSFKFFRQVSYKFTKLAVDLDTTLKVPPCVMKQLQQWIQEILQNPKVILKQSRVINPIKVFTDASSIGWGCVVFDGANVYTFGDKFSQEERELHINSKELLAVLKTFQKFQHHFQGRAIQLNVDNTTALGILKKKYSVKNELHNTYAKEIHRLAHIVDFLYVPSGENPADRFSRIFEEPKSVSAKYNWARGSKTARSQLEGEKTPPKREEMYLS